MTITVTDVNDKVPLFLATFYTETISESTFTNYIKTHSITYIYTGTPIGTPVITLTAFDTDSSGSLVYSIAEGNDLNYFRINASTGTIEVNQELDRETEEDIQMTIMVTDGDFNVREKKPRSNLCVDFFSRPAQTCLLYLPTSTIMPLGF